MFKIIKRHQKYQARTGIVATDHGEIKTPFFMPIATKGAVKGLTPKDLENLKVQIILGNTYHLLIKPGVDLINKSLGLHNFMKWDRPILTDSGGYQVYSLCSMRELKEEGVYFRSHLTGDENILSPEDSIKAQLNFGSDIIMVLDECTPYPCDYSYAKSSVALTARWAKRCKKEFEKSKRKKSKAMLLGIVQGSVYDDLRKKSAESLVKIGFDGYAIGGLAVGEPEDKKIAVLDSTLPYLPEEKLRYLMGEGTPEGILAAVKRGIDMFDCVIPTRNARHGNIFINLKINDLKKIDYKIVRIKNKKYFSDLSLLDESCDCYVCKNFSRAYIRHLFMVKDYLGQRLATMHNIRFYMKLMERIREIIAK